jgi:hypothetical protein
MTPEARARLEREDREEEAAMVAPVPYEPVRTTRAATPATFTIDVPATVAPVARATPPRAAPPRTTLTASEARAVEDAVARATRRLAAFAAEQDRRDRQMAVIVERVARLKANMDAWRPDGWTAEPGPPTDPLTAWEQRTLREQRR